MDMAKNKTMIIIAIIVVVVIIAAALFLTGAIHNGSFAMAGSTYGPGTYVIGTDLPPGEYDFEGEFIVDGEAIFSASSVGGLSLSPKGVRISDGAVVTVYEGGQMTYVGSYDDEA